MQRYAGKKALEVEYNITDILHVEISNIDLSVN